MRKRFVLQIQEQQGGEADRNRELKESIHSVSVVVAGIFLLCILGLFGIIYAIEGILPTPLMIADEEKYPDAFIAERAQNDLRQLTAIGPRIVGSRENEELAVQFLQRQISIVQANAHPNQEIQVDIQVVTGAYFLGYKPAGAINAYTNVQNIVVRVSSKNNSEHSLLVNAHFDSVPTSPGGSDDGINCAAMLEILRKITKLPDRPEHNIIFLFNGAEETPLQASHGFISQHKWAKEAKVLINLEAAGHGSKAILFQTSPGKSWLLSYYIRVPHPFGQASGEEVFQSNVLPSDTDYRVFRDFGGLIGYDIAFARNGYRYHTKFDDFEHIPLGSYQHVGDNVLYLVKSLSNAPELNSDSSANQDRIVYYDFIGWFMISYTETVAIIINILTVLLSTAVFIYALRDFHLGISKHTFIYLGVVLTAIIGGWFISVAFVTFVAFVLDKIHYTMSWYRNPWILFGLYSAPIVACTTGALILLNHFTSKNSLCINIKTQVQLHMMRMLWTLVLFIGTIMKIRSVYSVFLPVLFQTLIFIIIYILKWQHTVKKWRILFLLGTIIPTMFLMYQTILILSLFIPIVGRIGSERNSELYISLLTLLVTLLITSTYVPLITLVRTPLIFLASLSTIFVMAFILIFTPLAFAYSGDPSCPAPQRFWVYHTSRTFHDVNGNVTKKGSGFFILNMDRNSPDSVKHYVTDLKNTKSVVDDCNTFLACGLPFASIKTMAMSRDVITWIPAPQPEVTDLIVNLTYKKEHINSSVVRYNVEITGPNRQSIFFSPVKEAKLVAFSLLDHLPEKAITWNERDVYLVVHTFGKKSAALTFSFDLEIPFGWKNVVADFAVVGQYDMNVRFTPVYSNFLKQFPQWADVTPWVGVYKSWILL